jgi:hypothetical protein
VTVAGAAPAAASGQASSNSAQSVASISDDWPASASGYTVEIASIDKSGASASTVAAAKTEAAGKGATAVGDLDGDAHSGTPTGKYVIYSGRFSTKKQADAALAKLKKSFAGAIVLHVTPSGSGSGSSGSGSGSSGSASGPTTSAGSSQAAGLKGLSGSAYVKASSKLPKVVGTGGAPPPKDNKKAGGGSSSTCIGC